MAQQSCFGTQKITITKQGDTIDAALTITPVMHQYLLEGTTTVTPDWSPGSKELRPKIYPLVRTVLTSGTIKNFTDQKWYFNDTLMTFDSDGVATVLGSIKFKKTTAAVDNPIPALELQTNYANVNGFANSIIRFTGTIESGRVKYPIDVSNNMTYETVSQSSYTAQLLIQNGGVLEAGFETLKITAIIRKAGSPITSGVKAVFAINANGQWVTKNTDITSPYETTIGVNEVNGSAIVRCEFQDAATDELLYTISSSIYDETDPYMIQFYTTDGTELSATNSQTTLTPRVVSQGADGTGQTVEGFTVESLKILNTNGEVVKSVVSGTPSITIALSEVPDGASELLCAATMSKK